ncbi:MAG TPA: amidase [Streptosporangiaceae bacterium]|nr:amidase [Streptosporangiaceae bacterium]
MPAEPTTAADLCTRSALEIADLVRRRQVSPVELIQAQLDRIEAIEPRINAFQLVRPEAALREAAELAGRRQLADLPLAGVPVAIKDNVAVAGEPTRLGSAATSPTPAVADDKLVTRLKAAGCVVIGKTQLPELAIWPFTEPTAFAATHNPWNPRRTAGGSTGGGAAAVVAGMAALALGSDGGGSIRIPAACCGAFGLKPGRGLVPVGGGLTEHWFGLTEFGPIARTVADAAMMLDVLAGRTIYHNPQPVEQPIRIAFSDQHPLPGAKASPRVRIELDDVAAMLRNSGHSLVKESPPYPLTLGLRFNARWLGGIAQDAAGLDIEAVEPRTRQMVKLGRFFTSRTRSASADPFGRRMARWFADHDALITPTLTGTAEPIGTWDGVGWAKTMLGVANHVYTPPWNIAGLPAASVPFGHDDDGLPIGIQLVGPAGSEARLLSLAAQIEQLRPWPRLAPVG